MLDVIPTYSAHIPITMYMFKWVCISQQISINPTRYVTSTYFHIVANLLATPRRNHGNWPSYLIRQFALCMRVYLTIFVRGQTYLTNVNSH